MTQQTPSTIREDLNIPVTTSQDDVLPVIKLLVAQFEEFYTGMSFEGIEQGPSYANYRLDYDPQAGLFHILRFGPHAAEGFTKFTKDQWQTAEEAVRGRNKALRYVGVPWVDGTGSLYITVNPEGDVVRLWMADLPEGFEVGDTVAFEVEYGNRHDAAINVTLVKKAAVSSNEDIVTAQAETIDMQSKTIELQTTLITRQGALLDEQKALIELHRTGKPPLTDEQMNAAYTRVQAEEAELTRLRGLADALHKIDLQTISPLEAMTKLHELKRMAQ